MSRYRRAPRAASNVTSEELALRAKVGDERAFDELVERNMGFITRSARAYARDADQFEDLKQEARLGVLRAIQRYRPKKGKFSTYVDFWIRQYTHRAARRGEEIKLPVADLPANAPRAFQVFDAPVGDDGATTLGELLPDTSALNDPADVAATHEQYARVRQALEKLAPEARRLLNLYYGLGGSPPKGYKALAVLEGCSHEGLRKKIQRYVRFLRKELDES